MKTMLHRRTSPLAALLALLAASDTPGQSPESYVLKGEAFAIHNIAGSFHISAGTGPELVVEVNRRGRDGERLTVAVEEADASSTLWVRYAGAERVIYPGRGRLAAGISVSEKGGLWEGGRQVAVYDEGDGLMAWADVTVRLPRGARLDARLGFGEATVSEVEGNVSIRLQVGPLHAAGVRCTQLSARTGVGNLELEDVVCDAVELAAGVGPVRARGLRAPSVLVGDGGPVELELLSDVNEVRIDGGPTTMSIPRDLGATLEILMRGDSRVDFHEHTVRSVIGDGDGIISIRTGHSDVIINHR